MTNQNPRRLPIPMLSFSAPIFKHKATSVGRTKGHNLREHPTASQLPPEAWLTPKGVHVLVPWRQDVLDQAQALAKRKDAVVAVELSIQLGNQGDWRRPPTPEHPHGQPCARPADLNIAGKAVRRAIEQEFGAGNVVSIVLHTDESTPHWQCLVTPVHDGKLQAKHWLDGSQKMTDLKARLHAVVNAAVPCTYEKGSARGGEPHDRTRAAGAENGPKQERGIFEQISEAFSQKNELKEAKKRIKELEAEKAALFSKLMAAAMTAADRLDGMKSADRRANKLETDLKAAKIAVDELRKQVADLTPAPAPAQPEEFLRILKNSSEKKPETRAVKPSGPI